MKPRDVRRPAHADPTFIQKVLLRQERITDPDAYPFALPAVAALDGLRLSTVTYFVGENGSGKSTILEALAVAAGMNAEGGSTNFRFATRSSESGLHGALRLVRGVRRPRTSFFLRAESFFNLGTEMEALDRIPALSRRIVESYGNRSLHEQSHGESFLALLRHRFGPDGLYILDEPEAALSPSRQIALLRRMHHLVAQGCQFILATHAPIVMAYPGATIYHVDRNGLEAVDYEDLEHVRLTRDFLSDRERYVARILSDDDPPREEENDDEDDDDDDDEDDDDD